MKIAVIGGGGSRTPLLLGALTRVSDIDEVALYDIDDDRLARIAAVLRAPGADPVPFRIDVTGDRDRALDGAGAVLAAIRPGGMEARVVDESVPLALGVLGQETVGPGGIAFALRTIPAMRELAAAVDRRASAAWLVNLTNPAGIVTEAVHGILGDRAVGICDSPTGLCAHVAAVLNATMLTFDYAGLNHLGWIVGIYDETGADLLAPLITDDERLALIDEVVAVGPERVRALGALPNEYFVYLERANEIVREIRARRAGRAEEIVAQQRAFFAMDPAADRALRRAWRAALDRRHATYLSEARREERGSVSMFDDPGEEGYGAVAVDFLRAVGSERPTLLILNTANRGRLTGIGDDEVVEVTCEVDRSGVRPVPGRPLPPDAAELVARIKEVERLTIRAATTGSAALALDAIATHPLVPSRDVASRILDGYLARQPGLREVLA